MTRSAPSLRPARSSSSSSFSLLTFSVAALISVGCSAAGSTSDEGCVGATNEALKTCASGPTIPGVDVSFYNGTVDWSKAKGAGQRFAFARISDGLKFRDATFARNWPAIKTVGLVRGSYQFFRPSQDAGLQAQMVLDTLTAAGGLKAGDLPPVLDLESADGLPPSVVVLKAKAWLTKIEAALKVKPIVYTAAFMSDSIGKNFASYPLWVANYQTTCPTMPSGWDDWKFWQNSEKGKIAGIPGDVDTNLFNGTLVQLQAMTLKAATGTGAAPPAQAPGTDEGTSPNGSASATETPQDSPQGATLGGSARTPPDTARPTCR